ncbi:MAG: C25 family cysteine peptidase [Bacteroidetes bacterium]|nr:C25 family cysteine peptidase [Bacteroidota bacterium]
MKRFLLLLTLALSICIVRAEIIEQTYYFTNYKITTSGDYQLINFDYALLTGIPGEPALPYFSVSLLLPPGHNARSIQFIGEDNTEIPGTFKLYPQQYAQPISKGETGHFVMNDHVYLSDMVYPYTSTGQLSTQYMNGYAFALSAFTPVQYSPLSGKLSYFKKVTIRIETSEDPKSRVALNLLPVSQETVEKVKDFAQNADMVSAYPLKQIRDEVYQLLIITPAQYENSFQNLITLYLKQGIKTQVVTTEVINSGTTGQDLQEKIRNYIIQEYSSHGVEYILLAGDVELVPYRGFYCLVQSSSIYQDNNIPSDLYYSGLDGTWNDNGNNLWGEIGEDDLLPEIAVARMPFGTTDELNSMLNKTINYQVSPVTGELDRPLLAGEHLYDNPITEGSDYLNLLIGYHDDNGYITDGIPEDDDYETLYDENNYWSPEILIQKINLGKSFVHHCGHANSDYVMKLYTSDITNANFSQVNGIIHNFTLVYTHGCICGAFDYNDCIGEKMVTIDNFAAAFIGNSRYGWFNEGQTEGPSAHLHREFVDALYHDKLNRVGRTHMESRIATAPWVNAPGQWEEGALRWCFYDCNVLGDPAMAIWTDNPITIETTYPSTLPVGIPTLNVSVTNGGNAAEGLRCSLFKDGILYGVGITDSNGEATIIIDPVITDLGTVNLIVSGYNCLPTSYDIDVIPNQGAYVIYAVSTIHDYEGNGNGLADYGELISLSLSVTNVGTQIALNTDVFLSTSDEYITITDNEENYGDIANGQTVNKDYAFQFGIAGDIPDQHVVTFNLEAVSNETWNSSFSVIVNAPALSIGQFFIDDSETGDNDGNLDPGETATIIIGSANLGHSDCYEVEGVISTTSSYITLGNPVFQVPELPDGESFNAGFEVTMAEDTPLGTNVDLNYQLTSFGYQVTKNFITTIGIIMEDFETADFSKYSWTFAGSAPWTISQEAPYDGLYCARSGVIADAQTSEMTITIEVLATDSISFYRKVSSELDCDFLQFYIDETQMGAWSGESDWTRVIFPVTTGNHTFKWIYSKDYMANGGIDAVFVDYIKFPPVLIPEGIDETVLHNNLSVYPNPFRNLLTVDYTLDNPTPLKISLLNMSGKFVKILKNKPSEQAGTYQVIMNSMGLRPGVYFIRFETEKITDIKKVILLN